MFNIQCIMLKLEADEVWQYCGTVERRFAIKGANVRQAFAPPTGPEGNERPGA